MVIIDATMLTLILATLFGISCCLGDQTCSRNDCTLPATEIRGLIDCSMALKGAYCGISPKTQSRHFPPKPEQVNVKVYRLGENLEFNVTWQPGLNGTIQYLEGYRITIGNDYNDETACFEMNFTNKSQIFIPDKDGQLLLFSDCSSGFEGGLQINVEYPVFIQSLPVPAFDDAPETVIQKTIKIRPCESFSVLHGNVNPSPEFYIQGDVVNVRCVDSDSYKLVGPSSARQCLSTGKWNISEPKCFERKVEVETFSNYSALVKFDTLKTCDNKYTVRLRDVTHDQQLPKYLKDTDESSWMYNNLPVARWQACVKCSDEKCSDYFTIYDPTSPAPTTTRVTTRSDTTTTDLVSNSSTMTLIQKPAKFGGNPPSNAVPYIYIIVGCVSGVLLVALVYILRKGKRRSVLHSTLQEQDESPTLTVSSPFPVTSSIVENNNQACFNSEIQSDFDTITIVSGPVGNINIIPDGSV